MAGYEEFTGEYVGRVLVNASIILSPDPRAERHNVTMEGSARIREWPYPGYERRILPTGRVQIDLEMVESRISGRVSALGDDIVITETIGHRNFGTLTQINRGEDFPAAFALKRLVRFDTPIGVMYNEEPVDLRATLTSIPPVVSADTPVGPNVFESVNTPVPLLSAEGRVVALFSDSPESRANCIVRMIEAEQIA